MADSKMKGPARGGRPRKEPPSWALRVAVGGPVILAALYSLAIVLGRPSGLGDLGSIGDAFAPLTVAFSVAAVAVGLRSVELQQRELRLQRRELRLQRRELRESRAVMQEQREQFERTAKAQADLVRVTTANRLAQHAATIATLQSALVQFQAEWARHRMNGQEAIYKKGIEDMEAEVRARMENEIRAERALATLVAGGKF
jgi:hypothetical protein